MKNILFLVILSISIYPHAQHVHQYLTIEGYNLLKNYVGEDIPQFLSHLSNDPVGPPWTN